MTAQLRLYNTLTRQVEEFVPHEVGKVKMYTCGPTVYHYAHIGNLRTYIMEDVLEKTLKFLGYDVQRAMNITDVGHIAGDADVGEDKMLAGARREGKSVLEIAGYYTEAFMRDCRRLNITMPAIIKPATECIDEYIQHITHLIDSGYAYVSGGNVYFDTGKLNNYHCLTGHCADNLSVAVRDDVEVDASKRSSADFVLWFTSSKFDNQQLLWDSPWGVGYPGWHIECSAISIMALGEYLDIHCGGVDNIFPHHTNEIAQSEAILGHEWCRHWFHVQHLNTDSGKMSKSSGEFLTLEVLEKAGVSPMEYRFFCLQSHYRRPLVFSDESIGGAVSAYKKLKDRALALPKDEWWAHSAATLELLERFKGALADDLNTASAITVLYDVLKADISPAAKRGLLQLFDSVLDIGLLDEVDTIEVDGELAQQIEQLISQRSTAKQQKNYALADSIRDRLSDMGVTLRDGKDGTTWELR